MAPSSFTASSTLYVARAADTFYAPVVTRFVTYEVTLPAVYATYVATIQALPALREWTQAALAEKCFIPEEEPYRQHA